MAKPAILPGWPRLLCEEWAAAYVGQMSVGTFRAEVKAGRIPAPMRLTAGRIAWLIDDLNGYIDGKRGLQSHSVGEMPPELLAAEWDAACGGGCEAQIS